MTSAVGTEIVAKENGRPVTRDEFRARTVGEIPKAYSPLFHLAFPSLLGIGLIITALSMLTQPTWVDFLFVPLIYLTSNASEWRAHKYILHKRLPGLSLLYERHTPIHHRIYMTDDMAIRSFREIYLVLIPPYGIVFLFLLTTPITVALWLTGNHNLACLFVATTMFYVVSYEWLHLSYHLPLDHPISKLGIVKRLKRHHATHHNPELMQRFNFNVTVPIWDFVRGTIYRGDSLSAAKRS